MGELVREVHDESIATSGANQRARQAAVIGPCISPYARRDLERDDAGLERDFDDLRIRIGIDGFGELEPRIPPGRLQALSFGDHAVSVHDNEEKNDERQNI